MKATIITLLVLVALYVVYGNIPPQTTSYTDSEAKKKIISQKQGAWIDFSIDDYNDTISIYGILGNQHELERIIVNFSDAQPEKIIKHDVSINESVKSTDFALNLLLILSSISNVKTAEIKFNAKQMTIKGIVLNAKAQILTIKNLRNIFNGDINIVNNLELVFEEETTIDPLDMDFTTLPEL